MTLQFRLNHVKCLALISVINKELPIANRMCINSSGNMQLLQKIQMFMSQAAQHTS